MCVFDVYPCLGSISLETGNFSRQRETGLRFSVVDPSLLGSKIAEGGKLLVGKRERERAVVPSWAPERSRLDFDVDNIHQGHGFCL